MNKIQDKTSRSFGYEWSRFPDIHREDEANLLSYLSLKPDDFVGKDVIDVGCGNGRFSYYAHKWGARSVLALDASAEVVEVAQRNLEGLKGVQVIQANILSAVWERVADIVMCIGVLHHLEEPEEAIRRLTWLLRPGGVLCIWVYGRDGNRMARWLYEPLRKVTRRVPRGLLYWGCWIPAVGVEMCNRLQVPLFTQYRMFPFRTKWNDALDVFTAPLVRYYRPYEVLGMLSDAGLREVEVGSRVLNGVAVGIKAIGYR